MENLSNSEDPNFYKEAQNIDPCNIDDEDEEQIESTMVPLQDFEAMFRKKKKPQKAENQN